MSETLRKKEQEEANVKNSEIEIEKFERDFVLPLCKNIESDNLGSRSLSDTDTSDEILSETKEDKSFHSSSDSIQTDSDSGAFSRLSTPDIESESSNFSDNTKYQKNTTKDHYASYSDEDIAEGLEKETKMSSHEVKRLQSMCSSAGTKFKSLPSDKNYEFPVLICGGILQPSARTRTGHKTAGCKGTVTVNGVCYYCM